MYYNSFNDYLIDNRNNIIKNIKHMSVEELKEEVLKAYDFTAIEAIKQHESYKLLKSAIIEEYGQEVFDEIETANAKGYLELLRATDKYLQDRQINR